MALHRCGEIRVSAVERIEIIDDDDILLMNRKLMILWKEGGLDAVSSELGINA